MVMIRIRLAVSLCALLVAVPPVFAQSSQGGGSAQRPSDDIDGMADAAFDRLDKYLQDQKAKKDAEDAKRRNDEEARKKAEAAAKKKKHVTPKGGIRKNYKKANIGAQYTQGLVAVGNPANPIVVLADAQVDVTFDEGGTGKNVLGGAMFVFPGNQRLTPFGEGLVGFQFCCGETDLQFHVGGGVDIDIQKPYWVRASVGFRRIRFDGGSLGETFFTGGIVIPLGVASGR